MLGDRIMSSHKSIIVVFNSKNHSFHLEKLLKASGYSPIQYFAPSYLAKGCNSALKVSIDALDFIILKKKSNNIDIYRIYTTKHLDGNRVYQVLKEF